MLNYIIILLIIIKSLRQVSFISQYEYEYAINLTQVDIVDILHTIYILLYTIAVSDRRRCC